MSCTDTVNQSADALTDVIPEQYIRAVWTERTETESMETIAFNILLEDSIYNQYSSFQHLQRALHSKCFWIDGCDRYASAESAHTNPRAIVVKQTHYH